jgi:hypothetical protein
LSLVGGNGVAKLPDQFLSSLFPHFWLEPIDDPHVFWFGFLIPGRCFSHQFFDALHVVAKMLSFLLVLIGSARIATGSGPLAHAAYVIPPFRQYGHRMEVARSAHRYP